MKMRDDLDPELLALFERERPAPQADEAFVAQVMRKVQRRQRGLLAARLAAGLLIALLAVPLQDPLELITEAFLSPLFDAPGALGRELLSPLSSLGALLTVGLLALQLLIRRILR
ncbi:MAG: hypothetical protein AAGA68_21790 [Pseudomonadota bacterium]